MDRSLHLPFHAGRTADLLSTLVLGLAISLLAGCGGGDSVLDDGATPAPAPATETVPAPVVPNRDEQSPSKTISNGMTLPDDVELPADSPASDSDQPKGMHLPDDLQPSASVPAPISIQAVKLVGTSAEDSPAEDFPTDIKYAAWKEISETIGKTGKVTVVDLWSLACTPCLREYPKLVALQNKFPKRVQAIGVNLDYDGREKYPPQSYEQRAKEFLKAVQADFPNYLSETPSEDVFATLDIASLPAVLVFDEKGKLAGRFTASEASGGFGYQNDIVPLVAKLLGE